MYVYNKNCNLNKSSKYDDNDSDEVASSAGFDSDNDYFYGTEKTKEKICYDDVLVKSVNTVPFVDDNNKYLICGINDK